MQEQKEIYSNVFFSRICKSQDEFKCVIKKNEDEIRRCYAGGISQPKDFLDIILLDSIFIIELFLRNYEGQKDEMDYI